MAPPGVTTPQNATSHVTLTHQMFLELCRNLSQMFADLKTREPPHLNLTASLQGNTTQWRDPRLDEEDALIYIVAVLGFYSMAIVIIMIKHMRLEHVEQQEAQGYAKAVQAAHDEYQASMNHAKAANRLCLQALNTAHALPQAVAGGDTEKVTDKGQRPPGKVTFI